MSSYVNLEMSYTTYSNLCDAVEEAATHAEGFYEMQELVHLFDFLEEEYQRDLKKQNHDYETWKVHEELLIKNEIYQPQDFQRIKKILDDYEESELLEWKISEQDKFHLICEIIDSLKEKDPDKN